MKVSQSKIEYFQRAGFLPSEARELAHTSRAGINASYFQAMVRSRRGLLMNAIRYDWTPTRYRREIYQRYVDKGFMKQGEPWNKNNVWKMLRLYQDQVPPSEPEYESPWTKKAKRGRVRKKKQKRVTRGQALKQWIADLTNKIDRTTSSSRRAQLIQQRERLQAQLASLE